MNSDVSERDFYSVIVFGLFSIFLSLYTYNIINNGLQNPEDNLIKIILSPHFDDGVLSLGGMLNRSNTNTLVVTFLAEVPSYHEKTKWDKMSGFIDDETAVKDRISENNHALSILGVNQENLSFLDYQYRDHSNNNSDILVKEFEDQIEKLLSKYSNISVFMYGPSIFDSDLTHPDHKLLHDAFTNVIKRHIDDKTNHFYFYEDFPYVSGYIFRKNPPLIDTLKDSTKLDMVEIDIPLNQTNINYKKMAIGMYPSQIKAFGQMSFNLIKETDRFMSHRCKFVSIEYCEVVYKVIK